MRVILDNLHQTEWDFVHRNSRESSVILIGLVTLQNFKKKYSLHVTYPISSNQEYKFKDIKIHRSLDIEEGKNRNALIMNKKKKEEKRIKRGLLSFNEHMEKRKEGMLRSWKKNPKNKGKQPFQS